MDTNNDSIANTKSIIIGSDNEESIKLYNLMVQMRNSLYNHKIKTYTKIVSHEEFELYKIASQHGISPPIIGSDEIKSGKHKGMIALVNQEHIVLHDLDKEEQKLYETQIIEKIKKLHNLGILWLDASEANVVVDTKNKEAFIIDFGESRFMKDTKMREGYTFNDVLEIQIREIKYILGSEKVMPPDFYYENGFLCIDEE